MSDGEVRLERRGKLALVTLDRPEKKNALNQALWSGLSRVTEELGAEMPRAVVLTGGGSAFCAGMDVNPGNPQLAEVAAAAQSGQREPMVAFLRRLRAVIDGLFALPVPMIAAVNGLAYGGGAELATRCDMRVMDPDAVLSFSEVKLGLMPDLGGCVALTRVIGPARAAELILTARKVSAAEALALGLVNRVSEPGAAVDSALELAVAVAANGPRAVRAALEVVRRTPELSDTEALALELERAASLMATGECIHGIAALMSRSRPTFPDVAE